MQPDATPEPNSYDRPIAEFDLLLQLPEVDYVGKSDEARDYFHRLGVDVSHAIYEANPSGPTSAFDGAIADKLNGPYQAPRLVYGLSYSKSVDPKQKGIFGNLFFAKDTETYINCDGDPLSTEESSWGYCTQKFTIPDLGVTVGMSYDRRWLSDWKRMQQSVTALIMSFVVKE